MFDGIIETFTQKKTPNESTDKKRLKSWVLLSKSGEKNIALRYSEFEGIDTIINMKDKIKWVWVDCFTKLPINQETFKTSKEAGFLLCLVSPELQGRPDDIEKYKDYINSQKIVFDMICTKVYNIDRWLK